MNQTITRPEHASPMRGAFVASMISNLCLIIPFAVAISELRPSERIIYANIEFERLRGRVAAEIHGKRWDSLLTNVTAKDDGWPLSDAIADDDDYIGEFVIEHGGEAISVDAWSTAIQDDDGTERFRLLALADISHGVHLDQKKLEQRIREKDTLMRELQHRVKNNLRW